MNNYFKFLETHEIHYANFSMEEDTCTIFGKIYLYTNYKQIRDIKAEILNNFPDAIFLDSWENEKEFNAIVFYIKFYSRNLYKLWKESSTKIGNILEKVK